MGCPVDFTGLSVSYACGELASGGLKSVYLVDRADLLENGGVTVSAGALSIAANLSTTPTVVLELGFNNKDGFSNFTDVKTVNADGTSSCVPTIQMEFLRMNSDKRNSLEAIAVPGAELVAFVETAAGTYHAVGYEFGLYASSVDGASGASRTDKNRYQLTLVGDENSLALTMDAAAFAKVGA
jgi:hypothetical protein